MSWQLLWFMIGTANCAILYSRVASGKFSPHQTAAAMVPAALLGPLFWPYAWLLKRIGLWRPEAKP